MLKLFSLGCLMLGAAGLMSAAQLEGIVVDWACAKPIVKDGRAKVLKNKSSCSMMKNGYERKAYGLITQDKKYYLLEDSGNAKVKQLLKDTPDKDNLKVVVNGDIQGGAIKILTISEL